MIKEIISDIPSTVLDEIALAPYFGAKVASEIMLSHPIFQTDGGSDLYPHLRRVAVDHKLYKISKKNNIKSKFAQNYAKNSRHLELELNGIFLTASHVDNPTELPRKAIFRNKLASKNLLLPFNGDENDTQESESYLILTYGQNGEEIKYVSLKYPFKDGSFESYDLKPTVFTAFESADMEDTNKEIDIAIKKEIIEFYKKYENKG